METNAINNSAKKKNGTEDHNLSVRNLEISRIQV